MASSSTPRHEPKALATHVMPEPSLHANDEHAANTESADYILGESGLEDIEDSISRQSLAHSAGANAVEIANLGKNKHGGIDPDIRKFPTWDKIDHVGKAYILKLLSDEYGSFQKACKALRLEPVEVESFLQTHGKITQQFDEFHRGTHKGVRAYSQRRVTYSGDRTTDIFMRPSTIKFACKYLDFIGLDGVSEVLHGRAEHKISWPLTIDASDFDPLELGSTGPDFPHRASTPPDELAPPSDANPALADDCRVFVTFSAAYRERKVLRIRSIVLPTGAIVVGPAGEKEMWFGGTYRIIYPSGGWDIKGPDVHEFLICTNQAPLLGQGAERARQHGNGGGERLQALGEIAEAPTARQSSDNRDQGEGREIVPPGNAPAPVLPEAAVAHTVSPRDVQGDVPDVEPSSHEPAILFKSPTSRAHEVELRNLWLPDDCPLKSARASSAASMVSDPCSQMKSEANMELALEQGLKIHYYVSRSDGVSSQPEPGSHPHQPLFDPSSHSRHEPFQEAGTEGASMELANGDFADGLAFPMFDLPESQQQGPQDVEETSVLQSSVVNPQPAPFHGNENIFGPPRKQRVDPLMPFANSCSSRVLLQFRLPERYVVKSPTGFVMNFDDGNSGGGLGGVYTVVLPDRQAAFGEEPTPLPPIPKLEDRVQLRMNLAERMAIIKDSCLLPRLTEQGLHEMSMVQTTGGNGFDLVCQNGPYQVFRDMTPADDGMLLLNGHQDTMSAFESEGGSNGQSRGSSTAHEARRFTRSNITKANTQAEKHKEVDVDGGEVLYDGQGRENKRRKLGQPRDSATEGAQARDTAQRKLVTSPVKRGNVKGTKAARKPAVKKPKTPQTTTGRARRDAPNEVVPAPQGVPKAATERHSSRLAVESRIGGPTTATRSSKRLAGSSTAELAVPTPESRPSVSGPPKGTFKRPHSSPIQHDGARKRLLPDNDPKPKPQSTHKTGGSLRDFLLAGHAPGRGKNVAEILARGLLKSKPRSKNTATDPDDSDYADDGGAGGDTTDADATDIEDSDMGDLGSN